VEMVREGGAGGREGEGSAGVDLIVQLWGGGGGGRGVQDEIKLISPGPPWSAVGVADCWCVGAAVVVVVEFACDSGRRRGGESG
jgi:hypothetical protein